jgi:hypothetical protein
MVVRWPTSGIGKQACSLSKAAHHSHYMIYAGTTLHVLQRQPPGPYSLVGSSSHLTQRYTLQSGYMSSFLVCRCLRIELFLTFRRQYRLPGINRLHDLRHYPRDVGRCRRTRYVQRIVSGPKSTMLTSGCSIGNDPQ